MAPTTADPGLFDEIVTLAHFIALLCQIWSLLSCAMSNVWFFNVVFENFVLLKFWCCF